MRGGLLINRIGMCEDEWVQDGMFNYVSLEQRVPVDRPLCGIRKLMESVLASLNVEIGKLYKDAGCLSIAPEYIPRAPASHQHGTKLHFKPIFTQQSLEMSMNACASGEFQHVLKSSP
jgi:hypothetical protein